MGRIPAIKAVMTPFPWSIGEGEPMERAAEMMAEHRIRHLPVMDGERLVGVVGEREVELARRAGLRRAGDGMPTVGELKTERACVVDLDEPLDNVLLRMTSENHDCALVLRQGRLAGIFTVTDACRRFVELLRAGRPVPGDDAA